jgi:hypothetical protein
VPLGRGAAIGFDGQISVYDTRQARRALLRLPVSARGGHEEVACATMGVFAPLVGIVGSVQAAEALKLLVGTGQLAGRPAADARRPLHAVGQRGHPAPGFLPGVCDTACRPTRIGSSPMDNKIGPPSPPATSPAQEEEAAAALQPSRYAGPESAYRLAFTDTAFLLREELRPVRMQLELLKPEMVQQELGIESTIVIFGSARILPPEAAQALHGPRASATPPPSAAPRWRWP